MESLIKANCYLFLPSRWLGSHKVALSVVAVFSWDFKKADASYQFNDVNEQKAPFLILIQARNNVGPLMEGDEIFMSDVKF